MSNVGAEAFCPKYRLSKLVYVAAAAFSEANALDADVAALDACVVAVDADVAADEALLDALFSEVRALAALVAALFSDVKALAADVAAASELAVLLTLTHVVPV